MKIVVVYHCYVYGGEPPDLLPVAFAVVSEQMKRLQACGLADAASDIIIGVNGGEESLDVLELIVPPKAKIIPHGLESKCENPSIFMLENWLRSHPEEAYVLYFHAKSSSHDPASAYGQFDSKWAQCMMTHCVDNWRQCVADLAVYETAGCHWMTGQGHDHSQHYYAGTFFWARASFLRTLPSIMQRERIKMSGLGAAESKYEAEVWIGNGARLPTVRDYHPGPIGH